MIEQELCSAGRELTNPLLPGWRADDPCTQEVSWAMQGSAFVLLWCDEHMQVMMSILGPDLHVQPTAEGLIPLGNLHIAQDCAGNERTGEGGP